MKFLINLFLIAIVYNTVNATVSSSNPPECLNTLDYLISAIKTSPVTRVINTSHPELGLINELDMLEKISAKVDILMIQAFPNSEDPLYPELMERIGPMAYNRDLSLLQDNRFDWKFFFKFLRYYNPNDSNFQKLPSPSHQYVIKSLWEVYHNQLT